MIEKKNKALVMDGLRKDSDMKLCLTSKVQLRKVAGFCAEVKEGGP